MSDDIRVTLTSHYITPQGRKMDVGVTAPSLGEAGKAMKAVEDDLLQREWQIDNQEPTVIGIAPQGTPPAPSDGEFGVADCVGIKVANAYESVKLQLQFEIDGWDDMLKFTKASAKELVKKLAGVKKMGGGAFTEADMVVGKKFPGMWKVRWKQGEKYKDVIEVLNA